MVAIEKVLLEADERGERFDQLIVVGDVNSTMAAAIAANGLEAAQYQVALKQVESLTALGSGPSSSTIVVPANAQEAFGDAFKLLKGKA